MRASAHWKNCVGQIWRHDAKGIDRWPIVNAEVCVISIRPSGTVRIRSPEPSSGQFMCELERTRSPVTGQTAAASDSVFQPLPGFRSRKRKNSIRRIPLSPHRPTLQLGHHNEKAYRKKAERGSYSFRYFIPQFEREGRGG
jgi:hypothetical protein